jgi:DNA-binding transcriptional LysR family regulator
VEPGTPTLDQLRLFIAVVDFGSFGAAARKLNRAVSVVSYGIGNLEGQLGVRLFERQGTRKPQLTSAGKAVLAEARAIARDVEDLRSTVKGLLQGLEAEVSIAVDVMLPPQQLGSVLRTFKEEFPTVALRLYVEALGAVTALVANGTAGLGVSGPLAGPTDQLEVLSAGSVLLVPVAAPDHPLAKLQPLMPGDAREHVQLVLSDRSPLTEGMDFAVQSARTWRLGDLGAKHQLLREGIGWGNMPVPLIEADLLAGTLLRLNLPENPEVTYGFFTISRRDSKLGPAALWLRNRFVESGSAKDDIASYA